ncbi:alpha-N-arabinofuranosidase [bacterium]|nr:alpha-N-arabinofuranosidase [bacterium]
MGELVFIFLLIIGLSLFAGEAVISVDIQKPLHKVSPLLWGIFFEEINHAGEGGLYAELVRNRDFEEGDAPIGWYIVQEGEAEGEISVDSSHPLNPSNPRSLKISVKKLGRGRLGVANSGFWGIKIEKGKLYDLSLYARCNGNYRGDILVSLEHPSGIVYAQSRIQGIDSSWKKFQVVLHAEDSFPSARLVIYLTSLGTLWLDVVSLMPRDRWKGLPFRSDLMQMLADLKPSFVRFPGGCFVEGERLDHALRWRNTIGDIAERPGRWNLWGYRTTEGLGLHEYLLLCEALGAEPILAVNCGMSHQEIAPLEKMDEWIEDALAAIEYAIGPTTSKWGALREKNGHPHPFKLRFVEIGNENWGPAYEERYALFYKAIKEKYPKLTLIANVPVKSAPMEIVDEHYYNSPEWFIANSTRYDKYDRNGPSIFVGEYAVTQNCGTGNLRAAIGEAAFMTGLERNSDIVIMASYAPLFVNVNDRRWNPDLICFDNANVYGTPSYYVQMLFSENRGDVVLPVEVRMEDEKPVLKGAIGLGTWLTQAEFKDLKVYKEDKLIFGADFSKGLEGWRVVRGDWEVRDYSLQQKSLETDVRIVYGDVNWSDYTISLKARKLGGAEGFLIMFAVKDDNNWYWWNIGGWGNTRHAIERCVGGGKSIVSETVEGSVETGRWYDIKIEIKGNKISCYLDGKLIHEIEERMPSPVLASATKDTNSGKVFIKIVNTSDKWQNGELELNGGRLEKQGEMVILTGNSPDEENSFSQPRRVAPISKIIEGVSNRFTISLPPYSLTVLKLKEAK